ncbi:MAG: hypothetical protein Q9161_002648 [Pseudevernia consocians]
MSAHTHHLPTHKALPLNPQLQRNMSSAPVPLPTHKTLPLNPGKMSSAPDTHPLPTRKTFPSNPQTQGNTSMAPVLSPRALQELVPSSATARFLLTSSRLLRGNHRSFVSVKVDDELVIRVHRTLAKRFSPVWKRELTDVNRGIVTVTFPPDAAPTAPLADQAVPKPSDSPTTPRVVLPPAPTPGAVPSPPPTPGPVPTPPPTPRAVPQPPPTPQAIPPPPPMPSNKDALKFLVQWMEHGGADPRGKNAVPYPKGFRAGLEKLLEVASKLEVQELVTRVKRDLGRTPVPKPRKCSVCRRTEHPGKDCERCWHCKQPGHRRWECPTLRQDHLDFLERERRRQQRKERDAREAAWRAREAARQDKAERERRRRERREIGLGLRAEGADGTLPLYIQPQLRLGR